MNQAGFEWGAWLGFAFVGALGIALLWHSLERSDEPGRLALRWLWSLLIVLAGTGLVIALGGLGARGGFVANFFGTLLLVGIIAVCCIALGVLWAPSIGAALARPLTSLFDGGPTDATPRPIYGPAIARRKRGRSNDALAEVKRQLTICPGDFEGMLLLAEIQAVDLGDAPAAEATLQEVVDDPSRPPEQIIVALHQLAEVRLRCQRDLAGARSALGTVIERFPGTEAAYLAAQRVAHLSQTSLGLSPDAVTDIPMPPSLPRTEPGQPALLSGPKEEDPAQTAARCLAQLEAFPQDSDARERLAATYAEHYHRLDLARDQIERLITESHAPSRQIARWLNLLADWEVKLANDEEAARKALQRVVDDFPRSAWAEQARNRIARLGREVRSQQCAVPLQLRSNPPGTLGGPTGSEPGRDSGVT